MSCDEIRARYRQSLAGGVTAYGEMVKGISSRVFRVETWGILGACQGGRRAYDGAKMKLKWNVVLPILLALVFAVSRWPGLLPLNFSAAYGLAFCAGAFFPLGQRWWLPMGAMLATDLGLNLYYHGPILSPEMLPNYVAFGLLIWIGTRFNRKSSFLGLLGGGILGAILFYLVTNTTSWLLDPAYPKTLEGWIQALSTGRSGFPPTWEFFRNTLISGGLFTGLFAGAMKLSESPETEDEEEKERAADEEGEAEAEPEKAEA